MERDIKITFTLRINQETNAEIKTIAKEVGTSQNDLILIMISTGIKLYKEFIPYQRQELFRFLSQNPK